MALISLRVNKLRSVLTLLGIAVGVFSIIAVMTAMAGMFLTGDSTFASLAVATILVVAVAVLGSLTVLPALLSKPRRPRRPAARPARRPAPPGRR